MAHISFHRTTLLISRYSGYHGVTSFCSSSCVHSSICKSQGLRTAGVAQNTYMQFRLFDASNNQTIQHVTYEISVTRGTSSSSASSKPLLIDFFHAHNGLLTLHVEPTSGALTVFGEQDPILQAWVADPGGNILIRGPLLLQGGLYHFHVEIFTIDNDRSLFIPQQAPKFDAYLSVGDVYDNNGNYLGQLSLCRQSGMRVYVVCNAGRIVHSLLSATAPT